MPARSPRKSGAQQGPVGIKRIAAMAVVCHLCAFASIFDIYFRSPIVNGEHPLEQRGAWAEVMAAFHSHHHPHA